MLPDRVPNPGPLTYESGALPIALRGPACIYRINPYRRLCSKKHRPVFFFENNVILTCINFCLLREGWWGGGEMGKCSALKLG